MRADGRAHVGAPPNMVRAAILDPAVLARIIPGAESVTRDGDGTFIATLGLGVGPFRGRQTVTLRAEAAGDGLAVSGRAAGPFGSGEAAGRLALHPEGEGTLILWRYEGRVNGPVALAGARLLRLSAAAFVGRTFANLRREGCGDRKVSTDGPACL